MSNTFDKSVRKFYKIYERYDKECTLLAVIYEMFPSTANKRRAS